MSRAQVKFLRAAIYPAIVAHLAFEHSADDLHEYYLGQCYGWQISELFGLKRRKPLRRTGDLTTTEMTDFIDFITRHCKEQGIELPMENRE